jgi:hypothetical protein
MQRDKLTGLQAFATLTRASKDTNIKLVDVARWLVDEHESALATGDCRVRGLASKAVRSGCWTFASACAGKHVTKGELRWPANATLPSRS